ncbi:hypothetical protein [Limnoraphis robusta]|uniref:Uncharacterized protein n=1 Tax=Limnoraphis robusta CCNP1315 TaxID=3110306 RepID=A0ABU5U4V0_9CYAN|nr:hypothetical protein [Limnoraphis robusta]MEA5522100.1 hypothetical protein [Limnoraphis robusta CCNP1315]MEA5544196.1 hypothetical protein [Limnoraphis robusta CCNP1324]
MVTQLIILLGLAIAVTILGWPLIGSLLKVIKNLFPSNQESENDKSFVRPHTRTIKIPGHSRAKAGSGRKKSNKRKKRSRWRK